MKTAILIAFVVLATSPALAGGWKPGDDLPPIVDKQAKADAAKVIDLGNGRFANLPPLADTRDAKRFYDNVDRSSGGGSNGGGDGN